MNCKACGAEITVNRINHLTHETEDLCSYCLSQALMAAYENNEMIHFSDDPDDIIDEITATLYGED